MPQHSIASTLALPGTLLLAATLLSACGGGSSDSGTASSEAYTVDRAIDLGGSEADLALSSPATVAETGSMLLEVLDELDEVDDLAEVALGTDRIQCSQGSMARTTPSSDEVRLEFDDCRDGDDLYDGVVRHVCEGSDCSRDFTLHFSGTQGSFLAQSLDDDDRIAMIVDGSLRYRDYVDAADSGNIHYQADVQFAEAAGVLGSARLDGLVYAQQDLDRQTEYSALDGGFALSDFKTRNGACQVAGTGRVTTSVALLEDEARDVITQGTMQLSSGNGDAQLHWNTEGVTAVAVNGDTQRYSASAFEALCTL
jgi:hypothetical protein